jgi:MFS family permease
MARLGPMGSFYRRFDRFIGRREAEVFAALGHVVPDASVLKSRRIQHLLFSKTLSDTARDATKYAALVAVAISSGSAFKASLVTAATLFPAAMLGLYAGEIADSLPKRIAIALAYGLSGATCFVIPTLFGTHVGSMLALVFFVTAFSQLASPAENSAVPLVANDRQLASATAMMGLASSIGTALGTAMLAPLLLKLTGARVVFYLAGLLLIIAMTRVLHVLSNRDVDAPSFELLAKRARTDRAFRWLVRHPGVGAMVIVSVLVGVLNIVMAALAPIYVRDVLENDPTNTVYVMGPAGIAMTLAIVLAPWCIGLVGERTTAALGFSLVVLALFSLGMVEGNAAVVVDPVNPLRLVGLVGLGLNESLRTVAFLSVPLGLGVGITDNAVKTHISRRVPLSLQGRTFAVRNTLESGIAIVPLLTRSGLASMIGVSAVLILAPIALYLFVILLLGISHRYGIDVGDPKALVTISFWEDSDAPTAASSPA